MHTSHFAENPNLHLFEGDMELTPEQRYNAEHGRDIFGSSNKRGASTFPLWPDGILVYTIDNNLGKFRLRSCDATSFPGCSLFSFLTPSPPTPPPSNHFARLKSRTFIRLILGKSQKLVNLQIAKNQP